jgi:hypothetical protein
MFFSKSSVGLPKACSLALLFLLVLSTKVDADDRSAAESPSTTSSEDPVTPAQLSLHERWLLRRIEELSKRVAELEAASKSTATPLMQDAAGNTATAEVVPSNLPGNGASTETAWTLREKPEALHTPEARVTDFLEGTTINLTVDGYYAYNFNRPVGRVNLLRAYDASSNSFSINQATVILERAPDLPVGRRFGARVDLQYGQATETLQGSAANELRPQVYRPLFQVYGTYVAPVGSGLEIDFGKWASALGIEGNYNKDQINYSRSYFFNFLPFYHMGFRATYNFTPKLSLAYWLVNGAQQTEDFNGFKSQAFLFTFKPVSSVSWNVNYYFGEEQRDVVPVLNPGFPAGPTQPGLPVSSVAPAPNGREHIFDSYITWNATPELTLVGEADYVLNRVFSGSTPGHVSGGAAYASYQVTPKLAFAARGEYLSDRGGLFSGATQALKETTLTAEYRFADGFLTRFEWRRDFSNQPFFLIAASGPLKKEQNTTTVGLIWWWGQKQGSW